MKKLLLISTCLALTSTAAMAADMAPYTKAPVMAAPVFTWTGCYVGAHIGGGALSTNGVDFEGANTGNPNSATGAGAVAGGQLGCNYQDGNWVFGLEGEGYWSGIKATQTRIFTGVNDSEGTTMKNTNDFTIAARAGITFDRTLFYGKGGWAWGNYKVDTFSTCCGVGATTDTLHQSGYLNGFLVGLGIEHALTRNWTVKLEYDYIGFGAKTLDRSFCPAGGTCFSTGSFPISSNKQLFKVGFNYLFDVGGFR